jgi:Ca2+-binding EF-hand superfamily protein
MATNNHVLKVGTQAGIAALVLALANLGNSSWAATADKNAPSAGDAALFERLDANRDGSISANEVAKEHRSLFDRLMRRGDANHDQVLSREEFSAGLVPTRPDKPMEAKEPVTLPGSNAIRYLLLTMDTNRNARIEEDEVPRELKAAYELMAERLDKDSNGAIERQELSRGGPAVSAMATRYVARLGINVDAKLASLKKTEGEAFDRFEQRPTPLVDIRDPRQAKKVFAQFDENADGRLEPKEVPEPLREPIQRLTRMADRDDDGKLSEVEFVAATERFSKLMKRPGKEDMAAREAKRERKAKAKNAVPAEK